jgi:hypothetical protein
MVAATSRSSHDHRMAGPGDIVILILGSGVACRNRARARRSLLHRQRRSDRDDHRHQEHPRKSAVDLPAGRRRVRPPLADPRRHRPRRMRAASRPSIHHYPYRYVGGAWRSPANDEPGAGRWVTIYANADHAYIEVAGVYFDTAAGQGRPPHPPNTRPRWSPTGTGPAGFIARHPPGL